MDYAVSTVFVVFCHFSNAICKLNRMIHNWCQILSLLAQKSKVSNVPLHFKGHHKAGTSQAITVTSATER